MYLGIFITTNQYYVGIVVVSNVGMEGIWYLHEDVRYYYILLR